MDAQSLNEETLLDCTGMVGRLANIATKDEAPVLRRETGRRKRLQCLYTRYSNTILRDLKRTLSKHMSNGTHACIPYFPHWIATLLRKRRVHTVLYLVLVHVPGTVPGTCCSLESITCVCFWDHFLRQQVLMPNY
jgi:hypothetical protein